MDYKKKIQETARKFIPYREQLKDNRWKRKADEIKRRDNYTCTVCDPCHKNIHDIHKEALYCPCVCETCGIAITNKNCNTVERIGDYFRFKIYCDKCSGVNK